MSIDAGAATVQLMGSVGSVQPFSDLDITAGLIQLGNANFRVDGGAAASTVSLNGPVQLGTNVTFFLDRAPAGPDNSIVFGSTVNADSAGNNRTLTVTSPAGLVTFSGAVGNPALQSLTLSAVDVNAGAIGLRTGSLSLTINGTASAIAGPVTATTATLIKAGTGTLNLGGTNTYTGTTTINAGRLNINGSVTSNVSVAVAGTLGGSGTITGSVGGTGTVAPARAPASSRSTAISTPVASSSWKPLPPTRLPARTSTGWLSTGP